MTSSMIDWSGGQFKASFSIGGLPIPDSAIHPAVLAMLLQKREQNPGAFVGSWIGDFPSVARCPSTCLNSIPPQLPPQLPPQQLQITSTTVHEQLYSPLISVEGKQPHSLQPTLLPTSAPAPTQTPLATSAITALTPHQSPQPPQPFQPPQQAQPSRASMGKTQGGGPSMDFPPLSASTQPQAGGRRHRHVLPETAEDAETSESTAAKTAAEGQSEGNGAESRTEDGVERCFTCGETTHYSRDCKTYKVEICPFWARGANRCRYGADCRMAHGIQEERVYALHIQCEKCKGPHVTSMCRKRTIDGRDGQRAARGPYCSHCDTTSHARVDCPKRWCRHCENNTHWTNRCPKCEHCGDWHNSRQCPYVKHT